MADVVTRLVVDSKEYDSKIQRAVAGLTQYEKKCREVGGTLEFVEKEDLDFVKALGQMETVSSSATGKLSELKKAFTELSVQYKNLTDAEKQSPYGQALEGSIDQIKGRIGELGKQIGEANGELNVSGTAFETFAGKLGLPKEALGQVGNAMGQLGPMASGLGKLMTGALGPVGVAIAAVVAAIKQLVDAFKRNEDAMEAVNKIAAPFKAIWQTIQRIFDDMVKVFVNVYSNLERAAGGFDGFKMALSPLAAVLAAVRAQMAVVGTVLTDIAKAVAFVAEKVRSAMQGSTVGNFFKGITDTVQGFFTKFTTWTDKIANSSLGKKLGLDKLASDLRGIINTQDELTASNKRIAESENELNELRRTTKTANTSRKAQISELRYKASDKEAYSADERVGFLDKAMELEKQTLQANIALRQKEYELIKLKNSLTQSGTADLDAENDALNAVTEAQIAYNDEVRAMQRQRQSALNEAQRDAKADASGDVTTKELNPLQEAQRKISELSTEALTADEERTEAIRQEIEGLQAQIAAYKQIQDYVQGIKKDAEPQGAETTMSGPDMSAFEKLQQSIRIKLADQNFEVDQSSLTNLMTVAIQNGITGMDGAFEGLQSQLREGLNIPDEAWEKLVEQINDKLKEMNLPPITLDVKTGSIENAEKDMDKLKTNVEGAIGVFGQLGGAMEQLEDPGAKVAGIIMQAIASVAGSFAKSLMGAVGPWDWIAAAIGGVSTMISTIAAIKSATKGYASGGMVEGTSYSGDNIVARLNAGEGVLTQTGVRTAAAMADGMAGPQRVVVEGRISGKDILLSANNTNRAAGGSRGYYTKVK